jgi:hypothetical protein
VPLTESERKAATKKEVQQIGITDDDIKKEARTMGGTYLNQLLPAANALIAKEDKLQLSINPNNIRDEVEKGLSGKHSGGTGTGQPTDDDIVHQIRIKIAAANEQAKASVGGPDEPLFAYRVVISYPLSAPQ